MLLQVDNFVPLSLIVVFVQSVQGLNQDLVNRDKFGDVTNLPEAIAIVKQVVPKLLNDEVAEEGETVSFYQKEGLVSKSQYLFWPNSDIFTS